MILRQRVADPGPYQSGIGLVRRICILFIVVAGSGFFHNWSPEPDLERILYSVREAAKKFFSCPATSLQMKKNYVFRNPRDAI